MNAAQWSAMRKWVTTPYGEIAFVEKGSGPAALFVHGVLLNGYLWRDSVVALSDTRRCIAIDLLGHGGTRTEADVDVTFTAQSKMIASFLDALGIDKVDIVANDSGGGISQIFAVEHPDRVRTLTLTDCDAHDNYPPAALEPLVAIARGGGLSAVGKQWMADRASLRNAFVTAYENPETLTDESIDMYLGPLFESEEATQKIVRFLTTNDNSQNVKIEPKLRQLQSPTLIMWATDDVFFDKKWAYWLKDTIPGAREVVEVPGAKLFFPEERPAFFVEQLRKFWAAESRAGDTAAQRQAV